MYFSNEMKFLISYVFFGPAMVSATGPVLGHCGHSECTLTILGHCGHVRT